MAESESTDVLIVGAGPYGLSLASRLRNHRVEHVILGESMGFWRHNMPAGMYLRSSWDWYLDPQGIWTIERFLKDRGLQKSDVEPFPLDTYLEYVEWFRRAEGIEPVESRVQRLDYGAEGTFVAVCSDGKRFSAKRVVIALGFSSFPHIPVELPSDLPRHRVHHTLDFVDLSRAAGKSFLIVGGRQSAFEWSALLAEAGAERVIVSHRHPSPAFEEADWSWVAPLVEGMIADPGWFRAISNEERSSISQRLWGEGRLKVEPWLEPRLRNAPVEVRPESRLRSASIGNGERVSVELDDGTTFGVDEIILATGYKADISRVDFVARGSVFDHIVAVDGHPVLDAHFQSSVPGLYMTSMLATRDFGPFFGFTVACRAAATVLGDELSRTQQTTNSDDAQRIHRS